MQQWQNDRLVTVVSILYCIYPIIVLIKYNDDMLAIVFSLTWLFPAVLYWIIRFIKGDYSITNPNKK